MEFHTRISSAIASGLLMLAVSLGALGSHFLKTRLSQDALSSFEVGVRYLIYHSFAILLINNISALDTNVKSTFVKLILAGVLLFSGSIFLLATKEFHGWPVKYLGPITPIGGLLLISAWGYLMLSFLKK
ncbi:MAG: DUF423 domain-containing protein [Candidatus Arcticimaribacter sp.]|jgi:uncharacterized membrane protein YgdD (TMEM256/DUF423 family)|nr:DUF423 domain-containing protein [Flavobacteriaceae bacterium]PSR10186.1 MAG: DUF423 domain-containing protein [Candidatus Arcticimaribacter sp.]